MGRPGVRIGSAERHDACSLLGDGPRSADGIGCRVVSRDVVCQRRVTQAAQRHCSGPELSGTRQKDRAFPDQGLSGVRVGPRQLKNSVPLLGDGDGGFTDDAHIHLQVGRVGFIQREIAAGHIKRRRGLDGHFLAAVISRSSNQGHAQRVALRGNPVIAAEKVKALPGGIDENGTVVQDNIGIEQRIVPGAVAYRPRGSVFKEEGVERGAAVAEGIPRRCQDAAIDC